MGFNPAPLHPHTNISEVLSHRFINLPLLFFFVRLRNNWTEYHPHTNVLWLHYLCSKLLSMKYRGSGGRGAKDTREELTRFYGNVLQYSSATEALQNCPMFQ